jgi:hypothetical protein
LEDHKVAVSIFVKGTSGPLTWHADAFYTCYLTAPGSGDHTRDKSDAAFPFTTTSWFLLDAVEAQAEPDTAVVRAFTDSITGKKVNDFIGVGGLFDAVADFDAATLDPVTGAIKAPMQPNQTTGGPGELLHPNRVGYQAMAETIDLKLLAPSPGE